MQAPVTRPIQPSAIAVERASVNPRKPRAQHRLTLLGHEPIVLLTIPAWLVVVFIGVIPLAELVKMALSSGSLITTAPSHFTGLANLRAALVGQGVVHQLVVTLVIVVFGLLVQFPIGYAIARVLMWHPRFQRLWQSILVVPMVLTPIAIGLVWRFILDPSLGLERWVTTSFGLHVDLFTSTVWSLAAIIAVDAWLNVPFVAILLYTGLLGIPQDHLDAAHIDGANWVQEQRYVVLPLLERVLLVTAMVRIINDLMLFDIIYILTMGGPGTSTQTLSLLAYQEMFSYFQSGQAAAVALVLAIVALPSFLIFNRLVKPRF